MHRGDRENPNAQELTLNPTSMNPPFEQLQRQPQTATAGPPRRPPIGTDSPPGAGEEEDPPPPSQAVTELTGALKSLIPVLCQHLERAHCAQVEIETVARGALQEGRRQTKEMGKVSTGVAAIGSTIADLHRALAEHRRADAANELLSQIAGEVQLIREVQEKWNEEFINRTVADPLLAGYATVLGNLWVQSESLAGEQRQSLEVIAEDVVRFLDAMGVNLIRPSLGERLDPHRHQPIHAQEIPDFALHGCVAAIFFPGLCRGKRVILLARVSVYTCKSNND